MIYPIYFRTRGTKIAGIAPTEGFRICVIWLFLNNAESKGRADLNYIPVMEKPRMRAGIWVFMLLASSVCAFALDPSLDVSQYAHTAWKFAKASPRAPSFR